MTLVPGSARPTTALRVDVAVVGGGPSGAVTAGRLAALGWSVLVLERQPTWRWRAGGVFSSPAAMEELRLGGLSPAILAAVARPIPAMRVETPAGTAFRLTYGAESGGAPAVGFDRSGLDPALVEQARIAGADVRCGATVTAVELEDHRGPTRIRAQTADGPLVVEARAVIGADGPRSLVARAAGVVREPRLPGRVGLTWHVFDTPGDPGRDARMVVLPGGAYCGLAPVPGGRLNVGIVLWGKRWRSLLAQEGANATSQAILRAVPPLPGDAEAWRAGRASDAIAGASPLGSRVARRAGPGWLLVGDAAGFLDPFTGEGLHRALVSARLAAETIDRTLRGGTRDGLAAYERAMRGRFSTKDLASVLVQGFVARPALFEYAARRLARREAVRATMGLVMGDLVPASRALDPRFLAALLAP